MYINVYMLLLNYTNNLILSCNHIILKNIHIPYSQLFEYIIYLYKLNVFSYLLLFLLFNLFTLTLLLLSIAILTQ